MTTKDATALTVAQVRSHIRLVHDTVYFNSASSSPVPRPVIAAMSSFYEQTPFNYRSGSTAADQLVTNRINGIRAHLARFIGASSADEIVFTKNTTEAVNIVAHGIAWRPGDEVMLTPLEHQSNLLPWLALKERGVSLRYVKPDPDGRISADAVERSISPRTQLVAVHHVSNVLGYRQDISVIGQVARRHGAQFLVDAAQSEGRVKVSVDQIGCDYLVSCARKGLMGPQGVGFLWARRELLEQLQPLMLGSQAAEVTGAEDFHGLDVPYRHEAGILNTAGIVGLGSALEYVERIGLLPVVEHVRLLEARLRAGLQELSRVTVYGPADPEHQTGIVSWNVGDLAPSDVANALWTGGRVVVASGACGSPLAAQFLGVKGVVRSSVHCFNTPDEVDIMLGLVRDLDSTLKESQ